METFCTWTAAWWLGDMALSLDVVCCWQRVCAHTLCLVLPTQHSEALFKPAGILQLYCRGVSLESRKGNLWGCKHVSGKTIIIWADLFLMLWGCRSTPSMDLVLNEEIIFLRISVFIKKNNKLISCLVSLWHSLGSFSWKRRNQSWKAILEQGFCTQKVSGHFWLIPCSICAVYQRYQPSSW